MAYLTAKALFAVPLLAGALATLGLAQTPRVFFGNLHSHTSFSDGSGTPEQAYQHARTSGHLDFLAITEHNHRRAENGADSDRADGILIANDPSLYTGPGVNSLIPVANRLTEDSHFVAIYGQEFSSISSGNHVNVFDVNEVITAPNGRFDLLLAWLNSHPDGADSAPVLQFNHPALFNDEDTEYGADDFPNQADWVARIGRYASLIEILNGPAMIKTAGHRAAERMQADYLSYLNLGFHLAPTADQDNHYLTWGTASDARTAVIAPALTRRDLLNGLRARHVYATEDPNLELIFRVNGHLIGDVITEHPALNAALDIRYTINDRDEPGAAYQVEIFSDDAVGGAVAERLDLFPVEADTMPMQEHRITDITFHGVGQYVFFKVRQIGEDGEDDLAWTAPVWFEPSAGPPAAPALVIASLLADPAGDERVQEEVTLKNRGTQRIQLAGWVLRDLAGQTWSLDGMGSINAGSQKTIKRNGQKMSLNNGGDTVFLVDPNGITVHTVPYPEPGEGVRFTVP